MGIHGIYKEIGAGQRIALSKYAVEKFEETGRPLRIAIDVSIWLFQVQASKGGTNPALRTFYYRLLRLIALCIHPIFVFDGPNKPPFKRNKRTGPNVASIPEFLAKQLLKQFGFPIHLAPGEAEAECALLQREGIVDVVLSEDVDTLMFGSGVTMRNWSPEQRTGKTPTHVNVYDAVKTKNGPSGLDREGMILVALMSGGDYVPEGIPGCGPKTACEAARAGFGSELCRIAKDDARGMQEWRERLQHELRTNESKYFKRRHTTLSIPDDFPRVDILGYYTHPAISNQAGLDKLRRCINWDQDLDFPGLREFTLDAFDWVKLEGAKHFIRSLAPSLLVRRLRMRGEQVSRFPTNDLQVIQREEALLVKGIHGKPRQHVVTDNSTELRVSFTPIELVKIDLDREEPDDDSAAQEESPSGLQAPEADLDEEIPIEIDDDTEAGPRKRGPTKFDPNKPARVWVLETYVKVGVPLKVQDWEAEQQQKQQQKQKPRRAATPQGGSRAAPRAKITRKPKASRDTPQAPIERFAKVAKPGINRSVVTSKPRGTTTDSAAAASQLSPRSRKKVVDLVSSSPVRPSNTAPAPLQTRVNSLSPVQEDLPSCLTKRRRAPMQRSHTLPADSSTTLGRSLTPPAIDTIETLDFIESPVHPSPFRIFAKKARTEAARNPPVTRQTCGTSAVSSLEKPNQTTLDAWRGSATPTKPRGVTTIVSTAPLPAPPQPQSSRDEIETLDLTLSSPSAYQPSIQNIRSSKSRKVAASPQLRLPLHSISSNTSQLPCTSSCACSISNTRSNAKTIVHTTQPRRKSPRLRKTQPVSHEIETLDLTELPPPPPSTKSTPISTPPTKCSTAAPSLRRSPRNHDSPSSEPLARKASPPAAWKAQAKKKREIVLRKSLAGVWDYADVDNRFLLGGEEGNEDAVILKGKERRKWRESEIEVLDLC